MNNDPNGVDSGVFPETFRKRCFLFVMSWGNKLNLGVKTRDGRIPDIGHKRHEHARVNCFWPV